MKKIVLVGLLLASGMAHADYRDLTDRDRDFARVISSQPRYITTQQQVCQQGTVIRDNSGVDSAIGAVGGAVVGGSIAGRHDRGLGALVGGVAGAVIGNGIGKDSQHAEPVTTCHTEPVTVRAGDIVTFEYRGVRFTQIFGQ